MRKVRPLAQSGRSPRPSPGARVSQPPPRTGPWHPLEGVASGPLNDLRGYLWNRNVQTRNRRGTREVRDQRWGPLGPLPGSAREVFSGKATFAEKQRSSRAFLAGNDVAACVHRGLGRCQEQSGCLINICQTETVTSKVHLSPVTQLL